MQKGGDRSLALEPLSMFPGGGPPRPPGMPPGYPGMPPMAGMPMPGVPFPYGAAPGTQRRLTCIHLGICAVIELVIDFSTYL